MTVPDDLAGRRILMVEDDMLIGALIEEVLHDLGCIIVGPASKLEQALQLANDEAFDAAILDVTIRGGQVFPVAERLRSRGIPFVLARVSEKQGSSTSRPSVACLLLDRSVLYRAAAIR